MKRTQYIFLILFIGLGVSVKAQRILLLENTRKFNNTKYRVGDRICLKTDQSKTKHYGLINKITDSSIIVNGYEHYLIEEITVIYEQRWFFSFFSAASKTAGFGYFFIDAFNHLINNEKPYIEDGTVQISAVIVSAGYIMSIVQ